LETKPIARNIDVAPFPTEPKLLVLGDPGILTMTHMRLIPMTLTRVLPAVAVLLFTNGCKDLLIPDYNNSSLEDLTNSPTPTKIRQASQGLLVGTRVGIGEQNGYISLLGIVGRESYNFDPADPRFVTEMLIGPLDGGSPAFGGNLFADPYRNIRNANICLEQ